MATRLRSMFDRARPSAARHRDPVVVLATGGSGTRAVAEIMREAGVYLGPKLNRANDSLELKPFLVRWSTPYIAESGWIETVERDPAAELPGPPKEVVADFRAAVERQRTGIPGADSLWGWKNPRTTNLLPVLHAVYPDAPTAQLVRDGRDMAYSRNQNQLSDCDPILPDELHAAPEPVRSIHLWSRVNLAVQAYLRERNGGEHLVLLYEDLCTEPSTHMARLLDHLGVPYSDAAMQRADELIKLAPTTGRWRDAPAAELEAVLEAGRPALTEFGYV
jgi:Sulfotransferase family